MRNRRPPATRTTSPGAARRAEIVAHATEALDGRVNAMHWLQEANRSLGGRSPLAVLKARRKPPKPWTSCCTASIRDVCVVRVWRISKRQYAPAMFSGDGGLQAALRVIRTSGPRSAPRRLARVLSLVTLAQEAFDNAEQFRSVAAGNKPDALQSRSG
jgi:hypothetical protein